jgi:hypothetical protein
MNELFVAIWVFVMMCLCAAEAVVLVYLIDPKG